MTDARVAGSDGRVGSSLEGKTVLVVGAGRYQRALIMRAKALGCRVVAADRNADAPGFRYADVACVVDFSDSEALEAAVHDLELDGITTVQADRAVPVIARIAERRGLPGIGVDTARAMTDKLTMRETLASAGVPQPRFCRVRSPEDAERAAREIGFPAVVKPVDGSGQKGVSRVASGDELAERLTDALDASSAGEALVEEYAPGVELNGIVVVESGLVRSVSLADRLRPDVAGFGVSWIHLYPPSVRDGSLAEAERVAGDAALALGLATGIAFPQLIATPDGRVVVVECAARIGGLMAEHMLHARGIDLLEIQLRLALGEDVPVELLRPRFDRPAAVRFLTAEPGMLRTGRVTRVGPLDHVLEASGVVAAEVYATVGEIIRPVTIISDRRGWVIATGESREDALARADSAAALVEIEVEPGAVGERSAPVRTDRTSCDFSLRHYRELLEGALAGGYRCAGFDRPPLPGDLVIRHDVDLSLDAAVAMAEVEAATGVWSTWFLMTRSVFYNLDSHEADAAVARILELGGRIAHHAVWPDVDLDDRFEPVVAWHNPDSDYLGEPIEGAVNVMRPPWFDPARFRTDSNQTWSNRSTPFDCPHDELASGAFEWLHLLVHPAIWVYEGDTMRETMESLLDAERVRRYEQLRADRIDMS